MDHPMSLAGFLLRGATTRLIWWWGDDGLHRRTFVVGADESISAHIGPPILIGRPRCSAEHADSIELCVVEELGVTSSIEHRESLLPCTCHWRRLMEENSSPTGFFVTRPGARVTAIRPSEREVANLGNGWE
jgi:hypothetical protein